MTTIIVKVLSRCTQARMKVGPNCRSCRMYASGSTISPLYDFIPLLRTSEEHGVIAKLDLASLVWVQLARGRPSLLPPPLVNSQMRVYLRIDWIGRHLDCRFVFVPRTEVTTRCLVKESEERKEARRKREKN